MIQPHRTPQLSAFRCLDEIWAPQKLKDMSEYRTGVRFFFSARICACMIPTGTKDILMTQLVKSFRLGFFPAWFWGISKGSSTWGWAKPIDITITIDGVVTIHQKFCSTYDLGYHYHFGVTFPFSEPFFRDVKDGRIVIWYGGQVPGVLATKRSLDFAKALCSLTHIRGFYEQQQGI